MYAFICQGPPHKQRYLQFCNIEDNKDYSSPQDVLDGILQENNTANCGALMSVISNHLFTSGAFARFLKQVTTITMQGHLSQIRRFRPGEWQPSQSNIRGWSISTRTALAQSSLFAFLSYAAPFDFLETFLEYQLFIT